MAKVEESKLLLVGLGCHGEQLSAFQCRHVVVLIFLGYVCHVLLNKLRNQVFIEHI